MLDLDLDPVLHGTYVCIQIRHQLSKKKKKELVSNLDSKSDVDCISLIG